MISFFHHTDCRALCRCHTHANKTKHTNGMAKIILYTKTVKYLENIDKNKKGTNSGSLFIYEFKIWNEQRGKK